MKHLLLVTSALLLSSSMAMAAPSVTGNRISWPDDGWYQVQRADDFSTVCNGTAFCDVEPGEYNVINHTTMQRFTGIKVTGGLTVIGNTIHWPDDGWYQVQRIDDFSEICNGTAFCEVEPGFYHVINHTTMQRFDCIAVDGSQNSISAPNDSDRSSAPSNVSIQVYSATAAELFWTPQSAGERLLRTEIQRDGVMIGTTPGYLARSFFDDTRSPGVDYTYTLTAISETGRFPTTFSGNGGGVNVNDPTCSSAGGDLPASDSRVLERLFAIANGDAMERIVATALRLMRSPSDSGLIEGDTTFNQYNESTTSYTCPGGGTLELGGYPEDSSTEVLQDLRADACIVGPITLSIPSMQVLTGAPESSIGVEIYLYSGGRLTDARDNSVVALRFGSVVFGKSNYVVDMRPAVDVFAEALSVVLPDGSDYVVDRLFLQANGAAIYSDSRADLGITATGILGILPGTTRIQMFEWLADADGRASARPVRGGFSMTGENTSVGINADNGDADSFTFTTARDGAVTSYTVPFSERRSFSMIDLDSVNIGF